MDDDVFVGVTREDVDPETHRRRQRRRRGEFVVELDDRFGAVREE